MGTKLKLIMNDHGWAMVAHKQIVVVKRRLDDQVLIFQLMGLTMIYYRIRNMEIIIVY